MALEDAADEIDTAITRKGYCGLSFEGLFTVKAVHNPMKSLGNISVFLSSHS